MPLEEGAGEGLGGRMSAKLSSLGGLAEGDCARGYSAADHGVARRHPAGLLCESLVRVAYDAGSIEKERDGAGRGCRHAGAPQVGEGTSYAEGGLEGDGRGYLLSETRSGVMTFQ